jgi:hypothetical protein
MYIYTGLGSPVPVSTSSTPLIAYIRMLST